VRVRGGGRGGAGPVPVGQEAEGGRGAAGGVHRLGVLGRASRAGARAACDVPRRGCGDDPHDDRGPDGRRADRHDPAAGRAGLSASGGIAAGPPRRVMLAAFGDAGHAFPAIALGRELVRRGHEVCLETWVQWREHVEREGMRFAAAPEYEVFPSAGSPMKPYQAAVRGARDSLPTIRSFDPEVVVADILTVAAALAAEMDGRPWATLVPHVLPTPHPGFPAYAIGARLPRTAAGRAFWRLLDPVVRIGAEQGR